MQRTEVVEGQSHVIHLQYTTEHRLRENCGRREQKIVKAKRPGDQDVCYYILESVLET